MSGLENTAIFSDLSQTHAPIGSSTKQRELQAAFDDVLSKLGTRAIGPDEGETDQHYLAKLSTQAALYGPPDRRNIDRLSLPPDALANIAKGDLEYARAEIERPRHSLKPGETREVKKVDRSGRTITEFYNYDNSPGLWMNEFKSPLESYVSGGTAGICENPSSFYSFDKSHLPEVKAALRQIAYDESPAGKRAKAFRDAGLEPPPELVTPEPPNTWNDGRQL
jgi:hypothetical protein